MAYGPFLAAFARSIKRSRPSTSAGDGLFEVSLTDEFRVEIPYRHGY